jgi:hypothetical protein
LIVKVNVTIYWLLKCGQNPVWKFTGGNRCDKRCEQCIVVLFDKMQGPYIVLSSRRMFSGVKLIWLLAKAVLLLLPD